MDGMPPEPAREIVFSSESELRSPGTLLRSIGRDLVSSRELAWWLMVRDLRSQYRHALLGFAWVMVPPLAMAIMLALAARARVINVTGTEMPYFAYVLLNAVFWQTFVDALNGPIKGVAASRPLLSKIRFPREALVLAQLGEVLFHLLLKLPLVVAVLAWHQVPVGWTLLLAPLSLVPLLALGTLIGVLVAPLGAILDDVTKGLTLVVVAWFWLTPIAYAAPQEGAFAQLVRLNPLTPLLATLRELIMGTSLSQGPAFAMVSVGSLLGLVLALMLFRVTMPFVVERVAN